MSLYSFLGHFYKVPSVKDTQSENKIFRTRRNMHALESIKLQDFNFINYGSCNVNMGFNGVNTKPKVAIKLAWHTLPEDLAVTWDLFT